MTGIYKITNKVNEKIYIGQSVNIEGRCRSHRRKYHFNNSLLYRAMNKYGINNFTFETIDKCRKEELNDKEMYWIKHYESNGINGYNITSGGSRANNYFIKLNKLIFNEIIECLNKHELTQGEIAKKFNISTGTVSSINTGKAHYDENLSYPIRKKIKKAIKFNHCKDCGEIIGEQSIRCKSCYRINSRTVKRPTRSELKILIRTKSFLSIGNKYGVTDNAVRKWCIAKGLPNRKNIINNYSKEEWDKL